MLHFSVLWRLKYDENRVGQLIKLPPVYPQSSWLMTIMTSMKILMVAIINLSSGRVTLRWQSWKCNDDPPPCLTKCTISRRVHVYSFQRGWSSCIRQCHRGSRMWVSLQSSSSLPSSSLSPSSSSCHHHRHYHYHASASVLVQWSMIKTKLELLFKRVVITNASYHKIVTITHPSSPSSRKQSTERNCHKKSKWGQKKTSNCNPTTLKACCCSNPLSSCHSVGFR